MRRKIVVPTIGWQRRNRRSVIGEMWRGNFGLVSRNVTWMEWNADREVGYASSRSGFHKPGNNGWQNVPDTLYTFAYCGPFMRGIHNLTLALH